MKNQITKKLFAFILTAMMFCSMNQFAKGQCAKHYVKLWHCVPCVNPGHSYNGSTCVHESLVNQYLSQGWRRQSNQLHCILCLPRLSEEEGTNETLLAAISPNPISNSTTISFSLSQSQKISLKILDVSGRLVSTLADKIFEAGRNELVWNADDVNAGVYFLQFQSAENLQTEKLIVTK